ALGQIEAHTKKFLQMFRAGRGLPDPNTLKMGAGDSPWVTVYQAGYRDLEAQLGASDHRPVPPGMAPAASQSTGRVKNPSAVGVQMQVAAGEEGRGPQTRMFSPAPGIAEGLIPTAVGLFAAIPAVIAYNYYLGGIRGVAARMDSFASEFVS